MITPSAIRPTCAACSGVPIPKPTATGTSALGLGRGDQLGRAPSGSSLALAGRADGRDDVDEAAGDAQISPPPLGRGRRRHQRHQGQPGRGERLADLLRLVERQVGDDRARGARRRPRSAANPRRRRGRDHVRVDHQHDRHPLGDRRADLQRRLERRSASSAAVAAAWIVGPSASGSEKGTPSSIRSAPASA